MKSSLLIKPFFVSICALAVTSCSPGIGPSQNREIDSDPRVGPAKTLQATPTIGLSSTRDQGPTLKVARPPDRYSCGINSNGYCIFSGKPHQTGLKPGTEDVVDRQGNVLFEMREAVASNSSGNILAAKGTPAFTGDELIKHSTDAMNNDEKAFHRVMAIMFPIRNALMYDISALTKEHWNTLVYELEKRNIKDNTFTDGATPRDNYYGRQGVFNLAKHPGGRDIHHDIMKFLEESGLYLLCHVTSDVFNQMLEDTHPENHNPCEDAGIRSKIPFSVSLN